MTVHVSHLHMVTPALRKFDVHFYQERSMPHKFHRCNNNAIGDVYVPDLSGVNVNKKVLFPGLLVMRHCVSAETPSQNGVLY